MTKADVAASSVRQQGSPYRLPFFTLVLLSQDYPKS